MQSDHAELGQELWGGSFHGDLARVQAAIAGGVDLAEHGRTALQNAVCMNVPEIVRVLLEASVSAMAPTSDGRNLLHTATFYDRREIVGILMAADPGVG